MMKIIPKIQEEPKEMNRDRGICNTITLKIWLPDKAKKY